jgi:hypothetical protein
VWKHGFPDKRHVPKSARANSTFIIIVRDLNDWLHSTFKRPYHMQPHDDFDTFVTAKIVPREDRMDHPVHSDAREKDATLLELFERKFAAWKELFAKERCVLVNLK